MAAQAYTTPRTVDLNKEDLATVMNEIGMTEGFDVGLEMSGSEKALNTMIHTMKHGGKIALLGIQDRDAEVDLETVIFNGINMRGIYGRKVWDTWYKMTTMLQAGLDIKDIITHGDFPIVWTNKKYRMVYLNMGHGDEGFIDATQNLLFVNAFRWVVSRDPNGDPFKK